MLIRLPGIVLGGVVAWQLADRLPLGRGYALAGPAFAAVLLVIAMLAQRFATQPAVAGPRSASLAVRRVRDYLPRYPAWVAACATIMLVVLLGATTTTGALDTEGRAGRALTRVCGDMVMASSPWPGSYYSVPILIATGACLALTVVALQAVARRPRLGGDDNARRRAAEVIISAYGIAVLTPLAGSALVTVSGVFAVQCGLHRVDVPVVAAASGAVTVVVFLAYMVSVLLFGRRLPS